MEDGKQPKNSQKEDELSPEAKRKVKEALGLPTGNTPSAATSTQGGEQPSLAQSVSELATLVEFGRYAAFCAESDSFDEIDWIALFDLMIKHAITARQLVLFGQVGESDFSKLKS